MHVRMMVLVLMHLGAQIRRWSHAQASILRRQEPIIELSAQHIGLIWKRMFLLGNIADDCWLVKKKCFDEFN